MIHRSEVTLQHRVNLCQSDKHNKYLQYVTATQRDGSYQLK